MSRIKASLFALAMANIALATDDEMGPAAFQWPPDRPWSADSDNTPPCGSSSGVGDRTEFPLTGGRVALLAQDDSYSVSISIAFQDDPTEQSDFFTIVNMKPIAELDPGHTCFNITDAPASTRPGDHATIQLMMTADFDRPENQTFYACSDITYVETADFEPEGMLCFNATDDFDVPAPTASGVPTNLPGHDGDPPLVDPDDIETDNSLSGGAIAGIVVGVVAGLAIVAGLLFLLWREKLRKNRLSRQHEGPRAIKLNNLSERSSVASAQQRGGETQT